MTQWVFSELSAAAVRRDPNETQLFKTEQAGENEYAGTDALVREVLQNSMDAATGDGPVRIRLALHPPSELPPRRRLATYFRRLQSPLKSRDVRFDQDGVPVPEQGFLVCEDFGTRGLLGDPLLNTDPVPGSEDCQDFFWFWRNIGRSGKTGDDLGRWGLGKTVYRAASRVGCMLGLTVRSNDGRQLLMGQAVLRIHEYQGTEYVPEGYWCAGVNSAGLPLPIEDPEELQQFRSEWKLTREKEPGLSVVVPYVAQELQGHNLLQAVCVHFFLPILRGELIVDVVSPETGAVRLEASTLRQQCEAVTWNGPKRQKRHVAPPVEFFRQCLNVQDQSVESHLLGQTRMPVLKEAFDDDTLTELRDRFAVEQIVPIRIRMNLPTRRGDDPEGALTVFLQRTPNADRTDSYYVREGMTITKLSSRAGRRGIRALVLVDTGPLASLLGDSEGPAHEDWDTSEDRPNRNWKKWKGRVKFCRGIVDGLVELLTQVSDQPDRDLLSDFFSVERMREPQRSRPPDPRGDGPATFSAIESKPRWYRLDGRPRGFRVVSSGDLPVPEGSRLRIAVAYDVPTGSPLKQWSPFDFEFGSNGIRFRGRHIEVRKLAGNELLLTVKKERFSFSADGFDEHSDLFVKIEEIDDSPDDDEQEDDRHD